LTIAQYLRDAGTDARLTSVLHGVARACSEVTTDLQVSELNALQGDLGCDNVHGEIQKQMDLIAHDIFVRRLVETGEVAALVSEEAEEIIEVPAADARYLVAFDPMDGSSNVSLNMSVGSIFSVRRAEGPASDAFLRPGTEQVAAGYTIYGPSTLLVRATSFCEHRGGFA
jgi:fructose-1,6-bisphosphatase I